MKQLYLKKQYFIIIIILLGCSGSADQERLNKLEAKIAKIDSVNKNLSIENEKLKSQHKTNINSENINSKESKTKIGNSRFIGTWKFLKMIPDNFPNDHTMDNVICVMEKFPNTTNTYVFHLWTGHDLILSPASANTLRGENAALSVKYDPSSDQLSLIMNKGEIEVYRRLK